MKKILIYNSGGGLGLYSTFSLLLSLKITSENQNFIT